MDNERNSVVSRADCEIRTARVEKQMRHLWLPGRRTRLLKECYDIGYEAREIGASDLVERNFHNGIALVTGHRPQPTKESRATFHVVAACHNLLGIQYLDQSKFEEAAKSFDAAIEIRHELRRLFPLDRENEVYLGGALCNRGHASADANPMMARDYYEQSLSVLRQPSQTCECSYWDEERQSWWCEQVEALGQALNLPWVALAPFFIDNATEGLQSLQHRSRTDDDIVSQGES